MGLAMAYVANVSKFNFSPVSGANTSEEIPGLHSSTLHRHLSEPLPGNTN